MPYAHSDASKSSAKADQAIPATKFYDGSLFYKQIHVMVRECVEEKAMTLIKNISGFPGTIYRSSISGQQMTTAEYLSNRKDDRLARAAMV